MESNLGRSEDAHVCTCYYWANKSSEDKRNPSKLLSWFIPKLHKTQETDVFNYYKPNLIAESKNSQIPYYWSIELEILLNITSSVNSDYMDGHEYSLYWISSDSYIPRLNWFRKLSDTWLLCKLRNHKFCKFICKAKTGALLMLNILVIPMKQSDFS